MLAQEGLLSIACSSHSEQVAYLPVERSRLLGKIEALEQKLGSPCCLGHFCAARLQSRDEELAGKGARQEQAERDLDEAPHWLPVARDSIQDPMGEPGTPDVEQSRPAPFVTDCLPEETEAGKSNGKWHADSTLTWHLLRPADARLRPTGIRSMLMMVLCSDFTQRLSGCPQLMASDCLSKCVRCRRPQRPAPFWMKRSQRY
uniref:Uncharacterized protein n=1 Tax=Pogona vitticeps TaxID=103695 RepID=A0A6J0SKA7_9SAUR